MTREIWCKLFPEKMWPGDHCAIELMAEEIRMLRLLTDTVVTTALEQEPPMRPTMEVQFAHDLLIEVLSNPRLVEQVIEPDKDRAWGFAVLEALCWALGHDHNPTFAYHLDSLRQRLAALGIHMRKLSAMQYPKKGD